LRGPHLGTTGRSLVKTAFRDMMHFELSETALGHTQLSCVFKDPHLRNSCSLDSQGCEPVIVPAALHRRLPPAPSLPVQLQLAGLRKPAAHAPSDSWQPGAPAHGAAGSAVGAGSREVPDAAAGPSQEDADKASDADSGPCFDDVPSISQLRMHLDLSSECPEMQGATPPAGDGASGAAAAACAAQPPSRKGAAGWTPGTS
ncbi:unnamed protein product, partial [Prorocentrum cordatum]